MEEENSIKLVIFDLDGTLVKIPIDYANMYSKLRELLGLKLDIIPLRLIKEITEDNEELRKKIFKILDDAEAEAVSNIIINPEIEAIRKKFKDFKKVLVTMQGLNTVKAIIPKIGMRFDFIITREDSLDRFTQLKMALKRFKINAEHALFIGDRKHDENCARKLGCKFVRMNW